MNPIELSLGGIDHTEPVRWFSDLPLKVGDEVRLRFVECETPDEPDERITSTDPEVARQHKLTLLES